MKLINLMDLDVSFQSIMKQETTFKTALALNKLIKSLEPEFKTMVAKRQAIIDRYTVNGTVNAKLADKELVKLFETEIDLKFVPVDVELLKDLKMSTSALYGLLPFTIESKDNVPKVSRKPR